MRFARAAGAVLTAPAAAAPGGADVDPRPHADTARTFRAHDVDLP